MLRRTDEKLARQRARQAANSRRYRQRFNLGQRVYSATAMPDRLQQRCDGLDWPRDRLLRALTVEWLTDIEA